MEDICVPLAPEKKADNQSLRAGINVRPSVLAFYRPLLNILKWSYNQCAHTVSVCLPLVANMEGKKQFSVLWDEFVSSTTAHGLSRINSHQPKWKLLLWGCLFITATTMCIWQLALNMQVKKYAFYSFAPYTGGHHIVRGLVLEW